MKMLSKLVLAHSSKASWKQSRISLSSSKKKVMKRKTNQNQMRPQKLIQTKQLETALQMTQLHL